jgi:hypothetical protein
VLVKNAVLEIELAARKEFQPAVCLVSIKVANIPSQATSEFLRGQRLVNCTQAELIVFQSSLEIGDQYVQYIVFPLAEMSNMSSPAHVAEALAELGSFTHVLDTQPLLSGTRGCKPVTTPRLGHGKELTGLLGLSSR